MARRTPRARVRQYLWRLVEVVGLLLLVALVCAVFVWTLKYTLPFVIGGFFAVLLLPLVRWVEHFGVRRIHAVIGVLVTAGVALLLSSIWVLVAVTREAVAWSASIPLYFRMVQDWIVNQTHHSILSQLPDNVESGIESTIINSLSTLRNVLTGLTVQVVRAVTHTPESLFVIVIAILTTYFILANRKRMYNTFLRALPPGWEPKVRVVGNDVLRAFGGTIRVQIILMLMSAVLGILGLEILHIRYAVILGLLFGLTGMIPILGSALLTVPWAAGALLIGDVGLAIKIILLQMVISLIRHVVEPKILADSVGLDTLSTLFGLYVGLKLVGVIGLFLGPIVLIGIKSLLRIRLFIDFLPVEPDAGGTSVVSDDDALTAAARGSMAESPRHAGRPNSDGRVLGDGDRGNFGESGNVGVHSDRQEKGRSRDDTGA